MRTKSLTLEQMEARVARFNKLQNYRRQNFELRKCKCTFNLVNALGH